MIDAAYDRQLLLWGSQEVANGRWPHFRTGHQLQAVVVGMEPEGGPATVSARCSCGGKLCVTYEDHQEVVRGVIDAGRSVNQRRPWWRRAG